MVMTSDQPTVGDVTDPTPELRQAVRDAITAFEHRTPQQEALLAAYIDVTCGDCESGRCHGGSPCGCDRHEVSVRWREPAADTGGETR
jgi:hypothetical protein